MKSTDNSQHGVDDAALVTFQATRSAVTEAVPDFVDLTDLIADAVAESRVTQGRATVFVPEKSCSLIVNERESGLTTDLRMTIERLKPHSGWHAVLGSSSVVLPVEDGRLRLGRWQRIILVELTAAATRSVAIHVIGER